MKRMYMGMGVRAVAMAAGLLAVGASMAAEPVDKSLSEYLGQEITLDPASENKQLPAGGKAGVVVLSGCATGDGSMLRGEGVLGLTYGFLVNGSGSVIASLWPVEDASTARFMNEFYRAYRKSGNSAEALRSAQMRSRATSGAAAVWSSFVVRANGFP